MKTYNFTTHTSGGGGVTITGVTEENLTKEQKDLLLGELIKTFNDMPDEVKTRFLHGIMDSLNREITNERMDNINVQIISPRSKRSYGLNVSEMTIEECIEMYGLTKEQIEKMKESKDGKK